MRRSFHDTNVDWIMGVGIIFIQLILFQGITIFSPTLTMFYCRSMWRSHHNFVIQNCMKVETSSSILELFQEMYLFFYFDNNYRIPVILFWLHFDFQASWRGGSLVSRLITSNLWTYLDEWITTSPHRPCFCEARIHKRIFVYGTTRKEDFKIVWKEWRNGGT